MSSIHIPPIPSIKMVTSEGYPTPEEAMWRQQQLFSRSPWTVYTPTVANITALTVNDCAYVQLGKLTIFRVGLAGTSNGNRGTFTLPFAAKSANQAFSVALFTVGAGVAFIGLDNLTVTIEKYDGTAPAAGAIQWAVSGVYEAQ